jgi:uncharacterized protein (TIGR02145 family)
MSDRCLNFLLLYLLLTLGIACNKEEEPEVLTDYDGNTYKTVQIGDQVWMAENLRTTHYSDGEAITLVEKSSNWVKMTVEDRAYCYFENSINNGAIYGLLYTWAAAMKGEKNKPNNVQGVCPKGWHLPQNSEWSELAEFLGGEYLAGGKMKEAGTTHWNSPNKEASNESGFTGLPGGSRYSYGDFIEAGSIGYFWSTSVSDDSVQVIYRSLYYTSGQLYQGTHHMTYGFCVRCVKD